MNYEFIDKRKISLGLWTDIRCIILQFLMILKNKQMDGNPTNVCHNLFF